MKKLYFLVFLFLFPFNLKSQCLSSKSAFESYYEKNISELDPIEGFWSTSRNARLYFNGELVHNESESQISELAVIKDGSNFKVCDMYGNNYTYDNLELLKTANPNIYLYKRKYFNEDIKTNAVITGLGFLKYSYEIPQSELEKILEDDYRVGCIAYFDFEWIKIFPTQETYKKNQKSSGTGFAISTDGLIVTCNHVIENSNKIIVRGINNDFTNTYSAKIISADKNNDIAIIQIDDPNFNTIESIPYAIANQTIDVGSSVFALGYPLRSTMGDEIKLTDGIISAKSGYKGDITAYQISVPVQPGNSGGPLFDENGDIVGIVNAKNLLAENASYAVKISYLKNLLESLSLSQNLATTNTLSSMSLKDKVKILRNFTYIIEIN